MNFVRLIDLARNDNCFTVIRCYTWLYFMFIFLSSELTECRSDGETSFPTTTSPSTASSTSRPTGLATRTTSSSWTRMTRTRKGRRRNVPGTEPPPCDLVWEKWDFNDKGQLLRLDKAQSRHILVWMFFVNTAYFVSLTHQYVFLPTNRVKRHSAAKLGQTCGWLTD